MVALLDKKALVLKLADLHQERPVRRDDPAGWEFLWTFVLSETANGGTRLIVASGSRSEAASCGG